MNSNATRQMLRAYRRDISRVLSTRQATEHSYRPALQTLLQSLGGKNVRVVNEPSHTACGAPDFIIERRQVPIGHIECKNLAANLLRVEGQEQLKRYRQALPNLILTDHLEFRWYVHGELRETARLAELDRQGNEVTTSKGGIEAVGALFQGFLSADLSTISDPAELARRMAGKARLLRDGILGLLKRESQGPLRELLIAYREVLIADLSEEAFADLQAQTAAYGLFAARCLHESNSGSFTRQSAIFAKTTPFLRDVFGRIAGTAIDSRLAWIVDDLALLLDRANLTEVLKDFGNRSRREEPIVHFYEDFLATYDPELREVRGVYYTPEPIVSYIVNSVDQLLRDRFGLADGLAEVRDEAHPVLILDPAAGTGTFLCETVARIRKTIGEKGLSGAWPDYVEKHLLPRLFGFELLMAPYAICHLKLALEIRGPAAGLTMPEDQRLGIFLTNTLEEAAEQTTGLLFAHEIAREAASAEAVKRERPVMVVLGNPPYSGHSVNKGPWIVDLLRRYKRDPELKKPAQFKWLNNDYVKFIRFSQWRIEQTGEGILGFVTDHGYLDNRTFRDMRHSLMETFDEIYLLDLHGSGKRGGRSPDGGRDENVFDIQQGVAIGLFVKRRDSNDNPARVFHADLWGTREEKYSWLAMNSVRCRTKWTELQPKSPLYMFVPRDETLMEEYEGTWAIPEIYCLTGDPAPGIVTTQDQFAISWTPDEAAAKVERLLATETEEEARSIWRLCSQSQWQYERAKRELPNGLWKERIESILYRPFDTRVTIFDRNVAVHQRQRIVRHMLHGQNLGLCIGRAGQVIGSRVWDVALVSKMPSDFNLFRRGGNCLFPIYYSHAGKEMNFAKEREPNLHPGFVDAVSESVGLEFVPVGQGDLEATFGPEDVLHYIYAILYSPSFRERYGDFLKSDFPRIPLCTRPLFKSLSGLGKRLVSLHLLESLGADGPAFPVVGDNRIVRVRYAPSPKEGAGRVWINREQYFEGVAPDTWTFSIGGHRPAERWLKDRKNRALSFDEIAHYRHICAALSETQETMDQIDRTIVSHGGWPIHGGSIGTQGSS